MNCNNNYDEVLRDFGGDSALKALDWKFERINDALQEVKQSISAALTLKIQRISRVEEIFVNYQNQKHRQYAKEEQSCVSKINDLLQKLDDLKREGNYLHQKVHEETALLNTCRAQAKEVKKKVEAVIEDDAKACEQLERTKKCFSIAVGWYQVYLGIQINLGRRHLIVTFGTFDGAFHPSKHRLIFIRKEDGYSVEGETKLLSRRELMERLVQAREFFVNPPQSITQRDSEGSTTVSL